MAFGTPGGNFLNHQAQEVIVQLGYIGLILLVYEGGLSVPLASLEANIGLSIGVALTGLAAPIGLSFVLQPLLGASPLQAFAAGAALCATSLGTTLTVLSTSGLANTRLGSVLSTAAMMDDVVGLVMVQAISNLGSSSGALDPVTVIRPVFVSLGFALLVPLLCRYGLRPLRRAVCDKSLPYKVRKMFASLEARFLLHSLILFSLTVAASYSGTSVLFTAYLSGAVVNWWDNESSQTPITAVPASPDSLASTIDRRATSRLSEEMSRPEEPSTQEGSPISADARVSPNDFSGISIYQACFMQPVERVLRPFFFVRT
jgi:Kef-type K+ transport system membrane component KefB